MSKQPKCEMCKGTGYYGDNGPGIKGNSEYQPCECISGVDAEKQMAADLETGRKWRENSSIEVWFPTTAEELVRLTKECDDLKAKIKWTESSEAYNSELSEPGIFGGEK